MNHTIRFFGSQGCFSDNSRDLYLNTHYMVQPRAVVAVSPLGLTLLRESHMKASL